MKYMHGEQLPIIGGALDGGTRAVEILFPFLKGGIPNAAFIVELYGVRHTYVRDDARRCWRPESKGVQK